MVSREKIETLLYGASSYGVEIVLNGENKFNFYRIRTEVQKNQLEIVEKSKGSSIEELLELDWMKNIPIFLNVRGKGVLQKKLELPKTQSGSLNLIQQLLPNASVNDFYLQSTPISESEIWAAVIRKDLLDQLIVHFEKLKLHLIGVELGFLNIGKLSPLIDKEELLIDGYEIIITNGSLASYRKTVSQKKELIKIGNENLSNEWILAFSSSLNFHGLKQSLLELPSNDSRNAEFRQSRLFKIGLNVSLAFFFVLLLANFVIYQNYNRNFAQRSDQLNQSKSLLDRLESLKMEYGRNQTFFKSTDLISSSQNAFHADRLAELKPQGIFWNRLELNPSAKEIKKSEDIAFEIGLINILGVTESSTRLNEWLALLEKEEWINSIDIKDYHQLEKSESASFFLKIRLK